MLGIRIQITGFTNEFTRRQCAEINPDREEILDRMVRRTNSVGRAPSGSLRRLG
jgi:hypothetical protein